MPDPSGKVLLMFIPEDWYVCSHRLPLIRGARAMGLQVHVVTRVHRHAGPIREAGAQVVPTRLRRGYRNPFNELAGLAELVGIYRRLRPDLVHHVTPKSSLFGSLAARLTGVPAVINALAGLGTLYASSSPVTRLVRPAAGQAFRSLLRRRNTWLIVQNGEDGDFFTGRIDVDPAHVELIRGAGVDIAQFRPRAGDVPPPARLRVCLAARLIREKGIYETVEAVRRLRARRDDIEVVLAGESDRENPSGVPESDLRRWHDEGLVDWVGRVDDMAGLLAGCHVGLLPTYYREGLPKFLLEAAACGLPLVATDVTGCREVVLPEVNGIMIPPHDVDAIVAALERLADDPDLRRRMGRESRRLVEDEFSEEHVVARTMDLYRRLLALPGREGVA